MTTGGLTVLSVVGTRPEVAKLAPVIHALEADPDLGSRVLATAQHRGLMDSMLQVFGVTPDEDLDVMQPGQTLPQVTARIVERVDAALARDRPGLVLVQGDTATVFATALAAFYRQVPVGHVEAGLRSFDLDNPFPEEGFRRLTAQIARLHFAPTRRAVANLLREGVAPERVVHAGNTVVDALLSVANRPDLPPPPALWRDLPADGACPIYVTLHRRESWGAPLEGICRALRRIADDLPGVRIVYPVHPQPRVRETAHARLGGHPRIALLEPLDYLANVAAMRACRFIVTDSGGLQEEGPVLGKPVLVLRGVTERPEGVEAGTAWLVGTDEERVYDAVRTLALDDRRYAEMAHAVSPYGDGHAAERIVAAIRRFAGLPARHAPSDL